jgi:SAM-dependent methyltransferase
MPALPGMAHDRPTLEFYDKEAAAYAVRADGIGIPKHLPKFADALPKHAAVLDLGCGTGRDTRALIDAGLTVTAVDGSPEMAREAEKRIDRPVRVQLFEDLDDVSAFDGIWANASLLHVPRAGIPKVLARVYRALKPGGLLFASFKSGGKEGRDSLGRYYNYLNAGELTALLHAAGPWASLDLKEGRGAGYDGTETGWVAVFARKSRDGAQTPPALD